MIGFGRSTKEVVGLDVGANSIKIVVLEHTPGGHVLKGLGVRELPPDCIVAEEIKDREQIVFEIQSLIDEVDPKIRDVVVSISGHGVLTDKITIDKKTGAEAEQAILFEAEQRAPFDVEDVTLDYHVIQVQEETEKMDVLLVAARNEFLHNYLDLIQAAGLRPIIVDTDAFAILNSYIVNYDTDPSRVTALVNIGSDLTNCTFLAGGIYHSTRDVPSGGRLVFEAVQREFRLSEEMAHKAMRGELEAQVDPDMLKATVVAAAEELVGGMEVAFSYFRQLAEVPKIDWIILSGGGALIPFLPEFVQAQMNIPIEIANPLRNIEYDPEQFLDVQPEKIAPLLAVPVGLAARKLK